MSLLDSLTSTPKSTAELRAQAADVLRVLDLLEYKPAVVGGVLRVEQLGGVTKDIDIAVITAQYQLEFLHHTLTRLGYKCAHSADTQYATETNGFFADYHKDDVNVILYSDEVFSSLQHLVSTFDLNINKYIEHVGCVQNDFFDGVTVEHTDSPFHAIRPERITRFRKEYPELDWSNVPNA